MAFLKHAKLTGATLVIAKLDRLSRNAGFLLTLRDSGVRFVACDMPEANDLTVGIMALVAEAERDLVPQRTKVALAAARVRGEARQSERHRRTPKGGEGRGGPPQGHHAEPRCSRRRSRPHQGCRLWLMN